MPFITTYPNKILFEPTKAVDMSDRDVAIACIENLKSVFNLLGPSAIGLAANQIGENLSIFIFKNEKGEITSVVNPEILETEDELINEI